MKDAVEDRSHFGAWVITSSPLILGFDVVFVEHIVIWEIARTKHWFG